MPTFTEGKMSKRFPVDIFIVMNDAGDFVVATDGDEAAELAAQELGDDDDLRQLQLTLLMFPADGTQAPARLTVEEPG
jgi:hypothetical protein